MSQVKYIFVRLFILTIFLSSAALTLINPTPKPIPQNLDLKSVIKNRKLKSFNNVGKINIPVITEQSNQVIPSQPINKKMYNVKQGVASIPEMGYQVQSNFQVSVTQLSLYLQSDSQYYYTANFMSGYVAFKGGNLEIYVLATEEQLEYINYLLGEIIPEGFKIDIVDEQKPKIQSMISIQGQMLIDQFKFRQEILNSETVWKHTFTPRKIVKNQLITLTLGFSKKNPNHYQIANLLKDSNSK